MPTYTLERCGRRAHLVGGAQLDRSPGGEDKRQQRQAEAGDQSDPTEDGHQAARQQRTEKK